MQDHFKMMARYNRWANKKLFAAASDLGEDQYNQNCSVFFESMNGTLNHLYMADDIWLHRFKGSVSPFKSLKGLTLPKFRELEKARKELDDQIVNYVDDLDSAALTAAFTYSPVTAPGKVTQDRSTALAHFFNHQTHHRGHAHAALTQLVGEAPELDLIYYQREANYVQID